MCVEAISLGGGGMAKTGRPKVENPRSEGLYIRLTEKERDNLEEYATKHSLTKTQAVVRGIELLKEEDSSEH